MSLSDLYTNLAEVFDVSSEIEALAYKELKAAVLDSDKIKSGIFLPSPILEVMRRPDAHPICEQIAKMKLPWAPPTTSDDPDYVAHSLPKVHVELIGPDGLVQSSKVRLGLYGMLPAFEYGIRTHPAEEVFVIIAGEADWKRDDLPYRPLCSDDRAFHPSMTPHANRTRDCAFLSVYVWRGDVSTDGYVYAGLQ